MTDVIDSNEDFDSILVESEDDEEEIEGSGDDENKQLVGCTCDCDPVDHDDEGCQECDDCTGHWE